MGERPFADATWPRLVRDHHAFVEEATTEILHRLDAILDRAPLHDTVRPDLQALVREALLCADLPGPDPGTGRRRDPRRVLDWATLRRLDATGPEGEAEVVRGLLSTRLGRKLEVEQADARHRNPLTGREAAAPETQEDATEAPDASDSTEEVTATWWRLALVLSCWNGGRGVLVRAELGEALGRAEDDDARQQALTELELAFASRTTWLKEAESLVEAVGVVFHQASLGLPASAWRPVPLLAPEEGGLARATPLVAWWIVQRALVHRDRVAPVIPVGTNPGTGQPPPTSPGPEDPAAVRDLLRRWQAPLGRVGRPTSGPVDLPPDVREWWGRLVPSVILASDPSTWPAPPRTLRTVAVDQVEALARQVLRIRTLLQEAAAEDRAARATGRGGRKPAKYGLPAEGVEALVAWGYPKRIRSTVQDQSDRYDLLAAAAQAALTLR